MYKLSLWFSCASILVFTRTRFMMWSSLPPAHGCWPLPPMTGLWVCGMSGWWAREGLEWTATSVQLSYIIMYQQLLLIPLSTSPLIIYYFTRSLLVQCCVWLYLQTSCKINEYSIVCLFCCCCAVTIEPIHGSSLLTTTQNNELRVYHSHNWKEPALATQLSSNSKEEGEQLKRRREEEEERGKGR